MSETLIDPTDWETLKSTTDPAFLVELIDTYLTDSPVLIEQMSIGIATGEIELVQRAALALKSNSLCFGAHQLAAAAYELELIVRSGTMDGAESKLAIIEKSYAQFSPVLAALKSTSAG
jgi:HPt (histidine-containing phosphotransfer) domain-containing protein